MTPAEAKSLADAYLTRVEEDPCAVLPWSARETRTHWRFYWDTVAAIERREPGREDVAPLAVDKRSGVALFDPKVAPDEPVNAVFPPRPSVIDLTSSEGARAIAQGWLDATMEHWSTVTECRAASCGWMFLWQTDQFIRTGNRVHALLGGGPLVVVAPSGDLWLLGSALPPEESLRDLLTRVVPARRAAGAAFSRSRASPRE